MLISSLKIWEFSDFCSQLLFFYFFLNMANIDNFNLKFLNQKNQNNSTN